MCSTLFCSCLIWFLKLTAATRARASPGAKEAAWKQVFLYFDKNDQKTSLCILHLFSQTFQEIDLHQGIKYGLTETRPGGSRQRGTRPDIGIIQGVYFSETCNLKTSRPWTDRSQKAGPMGTMGCQPGKSILVTIGHLFHH